MSSRLNEIGCSSWVYVQDRGSRIAVGAPAIELSYVAESLALHVVVPDLDHPLGPQRHEGQVLSGVPARARVLAGRALRRVMGSPVPRVVVERSDQRLQIGNPPPRSRRCERA